MNAEGADDSISEEALASDEGAQTDSNPVSPNAVKLKLWLSFAKFLVGATTAFLVTITIDASLKDREITIRERENSAQIALKEQEHLARFTETIILDDVGPRFQLANYFASLTQSTSLKKGWADYLDKVAAEYQQKEQEVQEKQVLEAELEEALKDKTLSEEAAADLRERLGGLSLEITQLNTELRQTNSRVPEVSYQGMRTLYKNLQGGPKSVGCDQAPILVGNKLTCKVSIPRGGAWVYAFIKTIPFAGPVDSGRLNVRVQNLKTGIVESDASSALGWLASPVPRVFSNIDRWSTFLHDQATYLVTVEFDGRPLDVGEQLAIQMLPGTINNPPKG